MHDERVAVDGRVHVRVFVHDIGERPHDERQVCEREAFELLPLSLVRSPRAFDPLEVDPHRRVHVRARRLGTHHVLRGTAADVVERHDFVADAARDRRGCGRRAAAGAAGAGAAGASVRAGAVAPPLRAAVTTSLRVMRPPSPVPRIWVGSRPCSVINRRTIGDATHSRPRGGGPGCRCGRAAPVRAQAAARCRSRRRRWFRCRRGLRLRRRRLLRGLGVRALPPRRPRPPGGASVAAGAEPSEITARRAPTSTVSPSGTRISDTTPADGAGTSESTLSVETSNSGSSASIVSPTCLNHRVIVPSVTVSPSCGMVTSTRSTFSLGVGPLGVGGRRVHALRHGGSGR